MRQFKNLVYLYTTLQLGTYLPNFEMGDVNGEIIRMFQLSDYFIDILVIRTNPQTLSL